MNHPTTRDEVLEVLEALHARDTIFKVEVEDVKYTVRRAFEKARTAVAAEFTYAGKWERLLPAENALSAMVPYDMRHWFGGKFEKALYKANAETGGTPYITAIMMVRADWDRPHLVLQRLIEKAVSARRPVEKTRTATGTRPQLRAVCPCCFRQQAIKGDRMVDHGFRLQWEARRGSCYGHGKSHFGTDAGRAFTLSLSESYRSRAKTHRITADAVARGEIEIRDTKTHRVIVNPTERQLRERAGTLRNESKQMDLSAKFLEERVLAWEPAEPVTVQVEVYE